MNWFSRWFDRFWQEVEKFMTGEKTGSTQLRFRIYKDSRNQFRWRLLARNRKVIADSGESYKEKRNCMKAINLIRVNGSYAVIDDRTK